MSRRAPRGGTGSDIVWLMLALFFFVLISGCATTLNIIPRSEEPGPEPGGYEEMCADPERHQPTLCSER